MGREEGCVTSLSLLIKKGLVEEMKRNREKAGKSSSKEGLGGTNSMLTSPSVERTARWKETTGKFLWSSFKMRLKKASNHAGRSVKQKNMRRSTFVAVIPLLFFTSLCVFSLLGRQPLASAVGAHHLAFHDSGSSSSKSLYTGPTVDCTDISNATNAQCFSGGNVIPATPPANSLVVNIDHTSGSKDNQYLDGDPTCSPVPNPNDPNDPTAQEIKKFYDNYKNSDTEGVSFGVPQDPPVVLVNENTCTSDSTCYSDDGSGQDSNSLFHGYAGGDNITCYNSKCSSLSSDDSSQSSSDASMCGTGQPYDRFACAATGATVELYGIDSHSSSGNGNYDVYYNSTAYDPPAIIEIPTVHGKTDIFATKDNLHAVLDSRHDPSCGDGGDWSCPGDDPVIIDQVDVGYKDPALESTQPGLNSEYPYKNLQDIQPSYWVMCGNSGAEGKPPTVVGACTDDEGLLQQDWLSGDMGAGPGSGHLVFTALNDTINEKYVKILFGDMLVIAYALILPVCALIGYQLFIASWSGRTAGIQDTVPRVLIGVLAIAVSYQLVTMLIEVFDILDWGVVQLHVTLGYPAGTIAGGVFTYARDNDHFSYRGIVIPVNRWGCTIDDFVGILKQKLISDVSSFIPFIGGVLQFALGIKDAIELFERLAEFLQFLLSVNLCVQLFIRIIMINYYILMAPVAFGCWGLPAGVGEKVVGQWAKGFLSILFIQTVQLFVLTTLPLLAPLYPAGLSTNFHLINEIFRELPSVIVLAVVVQVPKLMGGAGKVMAQAGTVASGAVAAVGAAAYQMV